ncbi:MAG: hypothetical protein RMJ32_04865 [Aquificaceae bacterium]|nr:hypothetical protein [Aquificaceae bacterium]
MKLFVLLFIAFAMFSLFFESGKSIFEEYQYMHQSLLNLSEKAMIIRDGNPPRYENAGFMYAPFVIISVLIFKNPILASSIVSSLVLTLFIRQFIDNFSIPGIIGLTILIFNPLTFFLATQRFDFLTFYVLFTISVYYAVRHITEGFSLPAFISGMALGVLFFVDFRALIAAPLFAVGLWLSTIGRERAYILAITIVKLTPIVFFFLMWMYINWVFLKDPLHFIRSPYSVFISDGGDSIKVDFIELVLCSFLIGITYFFVLALLLKRGVALGFYILPLLVFYLIPALIITLSFKMDIFMPYVNLGVFLGFFAFMFWLWLGSPKPVIYLTLSFSSLLMSALLTINSGEDNERFFVRALLGLKTDKSLSVKEEIETANAIKNIGCEKVLTDDNFNYGVVYFYGSPKKFIMPYNYEFFSYLSFPKYHVDCLLINKTKRRDLVLRRFPKANIGFVKGYYLAFEGEKFMIYVRTGGTQDVEQERDSSNAWNRGFP